MARSRTVASNTARSQDERIAAALARDREQRASARNVYVPPEDPRGSVYSRRRALEEFNARGQAAAHPRDVAAIRSAELRELRRVQLRTPGRFIGDECA